MTQPPTTKKPSDTGDCPLVCCLAFSWQGDETRNSMPVPNARTPDAPCLANVVSTVSTVSARASAIYRPTSSGGLQS
jgi:hypothetical protein